MRKKSICWRRYAVGLVVAALACVLGTAPLMAEAKKNGWKKGYYYEDGEKVTNQWVQTGNHRYYVGENGKKLLGWNQIGSSYYFFNQKGNNYKTGKPNGAQITKLSNGTLTMGIDVSTWQGNVDWQQVKQAGVNFVMIRVGYGKGRFGAKKCTVDNRFRTYVDGASQAGIPIGIYFYSYATSEEDALEEAEFTIRQLEGIPISFPIAYDVEDAHILNLTTNELRTNMTKTFMDTVAAAGYYPMYYCNQNWYNNYLDSEELEDYDFWYARYTNEEPDIEEYPYAIWQATSTQKIKGITENSVDIDFLYKDYSKLITTRTEALKHGWYKEGFHWQYYYQGKHKKDGWFTIAGYTYYLGKEGALEGWQTLENNRYYFNSKGQMQTGIVRVGFRRYLFDENGILQYTTDEPGITIDEDGVCHIKKGWYQNSKGKYFYRNSNGSIAKNRWITTKGKKYYTDKDGIRVTGFRTIKKKRYYFNKNGEMVRGRTITIRGRKYTFRRNGQLK